MTSLIGLLLLLVTSITPTISLTVVHPNVKSSEPLEFTAVVTGPYEGGVCLVATTPDEHTIQGAICPDPWSDIDVKSGESLTLPLKFTGPGVGEFHIVAVLSDTEPPRTHSAGVPITIVE